MGLGTLGDSRKDREQTRLSWCRVAVEADSATPATAATAATRMLHFTAALR